MMKKSKSILIVAALLLTVGAAGLWQHYDRAEAPPVADMLIRFHVVANSDSAVDQAVKLKVRDAILQELDGTLQSCDSIAAAEDAIGAALPAVVHRANRVLADEGFAYMAAAALTEAEFPTKSYGDLTLPAGEYRALRVTLGAAEGKNWWCVLFPPLCFVDIAEGLAVAETEAGALTLPEETEPRLRLKLKLTELFSD